MHAFAGSDAPESPPEQMDGWRAETTAGFELDALRCGHFFNAAAQRWVTERVGRLLTARAFTSRGAASA